MGHIDYNAKTELYAYRVKKYSALTERYHKLSTRLSFMRLGIIVLMILGFYVLLNATPFLIVAWIIFSIVMFLYVVIRHLRSDRLKQKAKTLTHINQNEHDIIQGKTNSYHNGLSYSLQEHSYAHDLDVIGPFSLYHSLNRTKTFHGGQELANYMLNLSDIDTISRRKEAVKELEGQIEFRQELAYRLYGISDHRSNPVQDINNLLSHDLSFVHQFVLKAYYVSLPAIWILLGVCYTFSPAIVQSVAGWFAGVNLLIAIYFGKKVNQVQSNISTALRLLGPVNHAINHIFSNSYEAPYLKDMIDELRHEENDSNVKSLHKLKRIIDFLDYRLNLIVGTILNVLFLWDLRILKMLADWKQDNRGSIEIIFDLLGRIEAVMSLATWSYNNDQFEYADIQSDSFVVEAQNMHHPLLISGDSVANSISVKPDEHVTIITGSNMAGKSTFLRTIGANMVLAYAGTRITGQSLKISLVQLITYMRIKDNLEESVSTFKAELNRVSMILKELKGEQDCFVLIDEMLRGTNSVDKLTGSIAITKKLLEYKTHAMIATHDIQLAQLESSYPEEIQNYYFDISLTDGELEFDYKLKEGICDTFNASYLLRALDLDVPDHDKSLSTK